MADSGRAEKLAAARRKLRQFQGKGNNAGKTSQQNSSQSQPGNKREENRLNSTEDFDSMNGSHDSISNLPALKLDQPDIRSTSSSECIRQLSMQLNGLMSQTSDFANEEFEGVDRLPSDDLQVRNQELAALLLKEKQVTEGQSHNINELKSQNARLSEQLRKERQEFEDRHIKELGSLREQLQVHIQTIGILVAEKTELQSSLSQSQQTAKQKAGESDELQGRLKASRQRVADLERELSSQTTSSQQFEKSSKEHSKVIDGLKMDVYKLTKSNEELVLQNSELTEKLNAAQAETNSQQEIIEQYEKKWASTELHLKQLSSASDADGRNQLEELHEEKIQLEKKNTHLKDSLERLSQERDLLADNYQKLTHQLNSQVQSLTDQVSQLEKESQDLTCTNTKLEEDIQKLESERSEEKPESHDPSETLQILQETIDQLHREKSAMEQNYQLLLSDNSHMSSLVDEKESRLQQLESTVANFRAQQEDHGKLLEALESDKVAASRATSQNKKLKEQLEELQNGFIRVNNDKLQLTEQLHSEQFVTKELGERLSEQEEEMKELREQLTDKEERLLQLQKTSSTALSKQIFQQSQLADHMQHYEAQGHIAELVQQELNQALERVNALSTQNSELRTLLANQAENLLKTATDEGSDKESSRKDDMVASLSASVRQLELERDQLMRQFEEQQSQRESLKLQLKELSTSQENIFDVTNGLKVTAVEYNAMKDAMQKLEDRFTRTMKEIADLSDQKQQLEHLVMQLQGETETITEYVALYQVQRGLLKQRAAEKDEYIAQLARDREELKEKLTELQDLVFKLLYERQQFMSKGKSNLPGKVAPFSEILPDNNIGLPGNLHVQGRENGTDEQLEKTCKMILNLDSKTKGWVKSSDTTPTARKIMDLINEIESTNLVEKPVPDNFHPCPLCSGRLQTV